MDEGKKDIVTSEVKPLTRGDRIAAGIGRWVENQMPPAVGERYKKTLTVAAERFWGKQPELLAKLQSPIETAAKIAGWADPVVKVALGAATLYGVGAILVDPVGAMNAAGAVVDVSKVVGAAVVTAGVNAFRYVVEGVSELGKRVGEIWERIVSPIDQLKSVSPPMPGSSFGDTPQVPDHPLPPINLPKGWDNNL